MSFNGQDIITIGQLSIDEILFILETTDSIKNDFVSNKGKNYKGILEDKKMISAFFEDSTRTRTSFTEAMTQLGGKVQGFAGTQGTSVNKGESIYHTIKMLEGYGADAIVVRHKLEGTAQLLADKFVIPVLNAGDGAHEHPTQTLLDLYTIKETQKRLDNLTVALVGDLKYGRTVHSLATALSLFKNNKVYLVSPKEVSMPEKFLTLMKDKGTEYIVTTNLEEAVKNSDIVYMTRLQQERLPPDLAPLYDSLASKFKLEKIMLKNARKNLKILHPLPIPRFVQEVSPSVEYTDFCHYFEQAQNGLYTRMALLGLTLGMLESPDFSKPISNLQPTNFNEVFLDQKRTSDKNIADITNGIIIDHLPAGSSDEVIRIMNYQDMDNVFAGRNVKSTAFGKKDLIKIEYDNFDLKNIEQLNKLALISPNATINLVKDGKIVRKGHVELPSEFTGIIDCIHGECVSRPEQYETDTTKFYVRNKEPLQLECHYCGTVFGRDKIVMKH